MSAKLTSAGRFSHLGENSGSAVVGFVICLAHDYLLLSIISLPFIEHI
jgi:hypothetical protein